MLDRQQALLRLVGVLQAVAAQKGENEAQQAAQGAAEAAREPDPSEGAEAPRKQRERQPWDRQAGEDRKHYRWFLAYRDLGVNRTVRRALRDAPDERGGYGRAWDDLSPKVQDGIWGYRRKLAARWYWRERAKAWDDWRCDLAEQKAREREAELAIAQAERIVEQKAQLPDEAIRLLRLARRLAGRIEEVVGTEAVLTRINLERSKAVQEEYRGATDSAPARKVRTELTSPGALELLPLVLSANEIGAKLFRTAIGEPSEIIEQRMVAKAREIAAIIRQFVPEHDRDAVAERIDALLDGHIRDGVETQ